MMTGTQMNYETTEDRLRSELALVTKERDNAHTDADTWFDLRNVAVAEVARLREALEKAPHDDGCASHFLSCPSCGSSIANCRCTARYGPGLDAVEHDCDCWKARAALAPAEPQQEPKSQG